MSDDLYSSSGAIISLNEKTQLAKQMAGLYNKHVDLFIETRHLFRRFRSLLAYSGIIKRFSLILSLK